ncbi:hypothetical protein Leryth_001479 [Lithospermum erythrorhizon]|nr:hypothetical protein Leryth_001479 [Lithospermum erythrorhizon]
MAVMKCAVEMDILETQEHPIASAPRMSIAVFSRKKLKGIKKVVFITLKLPFSPSKTAVMLAQWHQLSNRVLIHGQVHRKIHIHHTLEGGPEEVHHIATSSDGPIQFHQRLMTSFIHPFDEKD